MGSRVNQLYLRCLRCESYFAYQKLLKGLSLSPDLDLDLDDYDMFGADAVIQRALFGKVIYG